MGDFLDTASLKQLHFIDPAKTGVLLSSHHNTHPYTVPPLPHRICTGHPTARHEADTVQDAGESGSQELPKGIMLL